MGRLAARALAILPPERVREAIAAANNHIYAEAQQDPQLAGMACVLTLALVESSRSRSGTWAIRAST